MPKTERMLGIGQRTQGPRSLLVGLALTLVLTSPLAPPLAPTVAYAQGAGADSLSLAWSAPGDDGQIGTASLYEMRRSGSPIDEGNWSTATVVSGSPVPLPAGTRQLMVVRGLTSGTTYYFAIKTADEAGNWSGLSNVVRWNWIYDTAPPAAPSGLSAALQGGGGVLVNWSPNSEADLAGYIVYRGLSVGGPFTALNGPLVTSTSYVDGTIPTGTETVWYQITARDGTGNESARSGAVSVTLAAGTTAWAFRLAFPNPSGPGKSVGLPLVVPPAGGNARIEIANNIGQRVRRIDLGALAPGTPIIEWDGRNDAGREVAPGAYTAWLIAGSTRIAVRLVRVP